MKVIQKNKRNENIKKDQEILDSRPGPKNSQTYKN